MSAVLSQARLVFWDFDGVIKDSVAVKTKAFVQLFSPFGPDVAERVRSHHLAHGGMSRFQKMPLYLEWAGQRVSDTSVEEYCRRFSRAVLQCVVAAPWVPGVEQYLRANRHGQEFVLVTATPQGEIEIILQLIDLQGCFSAVFGAPTQKGDAIGQVLSRRCLPRSECLMVGDAIADLEAARCNRIPFLLRRHVDNHHLFHDYGGASVEDFSGL